MERRTGESHRTRFETGTYLLTSAKHSPVSCSHPQATCLNWRNVKAPKTRVEFAFSCFYVDKGDINEQLRCERSNDRLSLDLKRGTFMFSTIGGPAIYGPLAESLGAGRTKGYASDTYVEHGFCNDIPTQ